MPWTATACPRREETHVSLFDGSNCGIALTDRPAFSVQHHPEASPGPQDSHYLFDRFVGADGQEQDGPIGLTAGALPFARVDARGIKPTIVIPHRRHDPAKWVPVGGKNHAENMNLD